MKRDDIIEAYLFLREHNQTIPSESLEFIKFAALEKFDRPPLVIIDDIPTSKRRAKRSAERLKEITAKAIDDPATRFDRTLAKRLEVKSCLSCKFLDWSRSVSACHSCNTDFSNYEAKL